MLKNYIYLLVVALLLSSCFLKKSTTKPKSDLVLETFKDSTAVQYAATITPEDLEKHLSIIASDEFEGRETARPGQKKAAKYISDQFKSFGLTPGAEGNWFQTFPVDAKNPSNVSMTISGKEITFLEDYYYIGNIKDTLLKEKEIVYAGYGIDDEIYSDYKGIDVTGKVVLIKEGIPKEQSLDDEWENWRNKVRAARDHGAVALLTIKPDFDNQVERVKVFLGNPSMQMHNKGRRKSDVMPNFYIKEGVFKPESLVRNKSLGTADISIDIDEELESDNVLGFIEGSDLKDEVLVITAHYDHLGYDNGEICNGADDDGTGTVSVIELAEAFQKAKAAGHGPRRSILFMTVSGEEKGLWGSKYYTDNPIYPLENTVADLNIDMVGRRDDEHDHDNYVYLIGADRISLDLDEISTQVNDHFVNFEIDYTYNDPKDPNNFYYRSDHYNFAKHGIPVVFYFSGVHKDYHKPTDDVEFIDFNKLHRTATLVFYTAWEIANRDQRLRIK